MTDDTDKLAEIEYRWSRWKDAAPSRFMRDTANQDIAFLLTHIEQLQAENERLQSNIDGIEHEDLMAEIGQGNGIEGAAMAIQPLLEELYTAVECELEDIGGQRGSLQILREMGPLADKFSAAVKARKETTP